MRREIIDYHSADYVCIKVIPHTSTRNYNSSQIAATVSNLYHSFFRSIQLQKGSVTVEEPIKCVYLVEVQKQNVNFYFIVPNRYKNLFKDKIIATWSRAKVEDCNIPDVGSGLVYTVRYKNQDALSLDVNKTSNTLLNNILSTLDVMEDNDKVYIGYNLMPCSNYGWVARYERTVQNYLKGNIVAKGFGQTLQIIDLGLQIVSWCLELAFGVLDGFIDNKVPANGPNSVKVTPPELSSYTKAKKRAKLVNLQIAVLSSSKSKMRATVNAAAVCECFEQLPGDNKLLFDRSTTTTIPVTSHRWRNVPMNKVSTNECQNFLQLPGKELLKEHKISHNELLETPVPTELQQGVMPLGINEYKTTKTKAYLSTDKSYQYLTWVLIGPTRAGKSTLISNACYSSATAGECNIVLDWCGNCELSSDLKAALKGTNVLDIDCSDLHHLEGLGYNELYYEGDDYMLKYKCSKEQATQLRTLVNCIQDQSDDGMHGRMDRYFGAAALVVAVNNGPINDVFELLQDYNIRHKYINKIPAALQGRLKKYVQYLGELDDDKNQSTRISYVQGILNRLSRLEQNTYMELMLSNSCDKNLNFVDEIQKNQTILIRMNDDMFATQDEKDLYATYWLTKIWGALQKRKFSINPEEAVKVNIYFDELYQVENCQAFLKAKLSQIAKFWAKPIISCHYIQQIPNIRPELKSANASYTLIAGSDKDNYKELRSELTPFTEEDLLNLKRYHALNLIKCNDGYARFITALPKPLS